MNFYSTEGVSPPPSSPVHSLAELPQSLRLQDIYHDPRKVPGPSLYVKATLGLSAVTGSIAKNSNGVHCAVAGRDFLKVLRVTRPPLLPFDEAPPISKRSRILGRGPGSATIQEEASARLALNYTSTDVGWGHSHNSHKIVVTCINGEVLILDHARAGIQLDRTMKEHTRAIHAICFTSLDPNRFATASNDGYVKLWVIDFRSSGDSVTSLDHRSPLRAFTFSPLDANHIVVALENGSLYKWDIRSVNLIDRVNAAHRRPVLGMEWIVPGAEAESKGWLCTGGMDKTVKIWDMSAPLTQAPLHVLHTAESVKQVKWRPGHDCELAVVPQTPGIAISAEKDAGGEDVSISADADRIEIWDVRRGWIPKYVLEGGEGAVGDIEWSNSGALWATYKNGTFVQHDLRECYRPLDNITRSPLTWDAAGTVTYATESVSLADVPFDDMKPSFKQQLADRGHKDKSPADPDFTPSNQTLAIVSLPVFDIAAFVHLARGYVLSGDASVQKPDLCLINAEVAHRAAQYRASQTWLMMHSLLIPMTSQPIHSTIISSPRPLASARTPSLAPLFANAPLPLTFHATINRRAASTSAVPQLNPKTPTSGTYPKSSSNSPSSENRRRHPSTQSNPVPMPSSSATRPSMSRRSSNSTRVGQDSRESTQKRGSRVGGSRSRSQSMNSRASSRHIGDGALEDESDEDSSPHEGLYGLGVTTTTSPGSLTSIGQPLHQPPSIVFSPSSLSTVHNHAHNPNSFTWDAPDEADEEQFAIHRRDLSEISAGSTLYPPHIRSPDHSDDAGALADDNYNSSSSSGRDSPPVAPPSSPTERNLHNIAARPRISKKDSRSSIQTAVPSNKPKEKLRTLRTSGSSRLQTSASSDNDTDGTKRAVSAHDYMQLYSSGTEGERGKLITGPSVIPASPDPPKHLSIGAWTKGAPITPIDEDDFGSQRSYPIPPTKSQSRRPSMDTYGAREDLVQLVESAKKKGTLASNEALAVAVVKTGLDEDWVEKYTIEHTYPQADAAYVAKEEEIMREIGWSAMKDTFEYYTERGDVQMCTTMAAIARPHLLGDDEHHILTRMASSYVDLLCRLRLFTSAAHVRRNSNVAELGADTNANTTVYASCARCKKALRGPAADRSSTLAAGGIQSSEVDATDHAPASKILIKGVFGFCSSCKSSAAKCSICRLPVKGLHFLCTICSHGGHHECYQRYYMRRPMLPPQEAHDSFGTPGNLGWGLAAGCSSGHSRPTTASSSVTATEVSFGGYSITQADDGLSDAEKDPSVAGLSRTASSGMVGLGLGSFGNMGGREKERDSSLKRKIMGHPCAAGCGHLCWAANDALI